MCEILSFFPHHGGGKIIVMSLARETTGTMGMGLTKHLHKHTFVCELISPQHLQGNETTF